MKYVYALVASTSLQIAVTTHAYFILGVTLIASFATLDLIIKEK